MSDAITFKLSKPIQAHGAELAELALRRPTVKELRQCGAPYRVVQGGVQWDYDACARLLVAICGIPPSSVEQLDAADFDDLAAILVGFTKRAPVAASGSGSPPSS